MKRYWKRIDGKLVEVFPDKSSPGITIINRGSQWSRTTKVEFSESTIDESIRKMKK